MTHILKCWPEYFAAIKSGVKTFEVRADDRGDALIGHGRFSVGDRLLLREYDREHGYSGFECSVDVTYVARLDVLFGLHGLVVMAVVLSG